MQNQKGFSFLAIIMVIAFVAVIGTGGYISYQYYLETKQQPEQIVCTQDAKQCPDGSYVSRVAPDCEFAECPATTDETADWKTYRNEEYGFEFKYPEDFFSGISSPDIKIIQCDYANFVNKCPFVPVGGFTTGNEESAFRQKFAVKPTPERITVNGISFCRQENPEGAAGTDYVTYNYTTAREEKCFVVSFLVKYPRCSNYLPIESQENQKAYDKCILDNEVTKPGTIKQIISTFKFTN